MQIATFKMQTISVVSPLKFFEDIWLSKIDIGKKTQFFLTLN